MPNNDLQIEDPAESRKLDNILMIFLVILLLGILLIPSEWLLEWSMWWNNIQ